MAKSLRSLCYSGKLLPVEPNHVLTVSGKTKESAEYFDFFLGSDNGVKDDFGDIQLHVSFNFAGVPSIVRNSYTKGVGWEGKEEKEENLLLNNSPNPIKRGGDFKITIFVDKNVFYISLDDKPFCTYPFRLPVHGIRRVNVYGDVEKVYEVNHTTSQRREASKGNEGNFSCSAPAIKRGMAMIFSATPSGPSNGHFEVNLKESASGRFFFELKSDVATGKIIASSPSRNHSR